MTLKAVAQYCQGKLNDASLRYLHEKRGVDDEFIKKFGLGYCPFEVEELVATIGKDNLLKKGMIFETNEGEICCLFRNSIVFPFINQYGKVVSISFRSMQSNEVIKSKNLRKYWHVSFVKGSFLYGLNRALCTIRQQEIAIVVEGQFDVIVSHQFGITNTIGAVGSALTAQHIKMLSRFAKKIVVVFDGDKAGRDASEKIELKRDKVKDVDIVIVKLPEGDDVDSFLQSQGYEAYKKLISSAT
jgi:DNA primase